MAQVKITERELDTVQYAPVSTGGPIEKKTSGLREHPYTATVGGIVVLIFIGALLVEKHAAVSPAGGTAAWGGTNGSLTDPSYQPISQPQDSNPILQQVQNAPPYAYTAPNGTPGTDQKPADSSGDGFDMKAFLASFTKQPAQPAATGPQKTPQLSDAYAFIPTGMISTSSTGKSMTPSQQALYLYGNEVGSLIQTYDTAHPQVAQILKDQIEDRTNASKIQAVNLIGDDLINIGTTMDGMEDVPAAARASHQDLATSYKQIGAELKKVTAAQQDAEFLAAIKQYDARANIFIQRYVSLAGVFTLNGVTFAPEDSGSVFTFSPSGSF